MVQRTQHLVIRVCDDSSELRVIAMIAAPNILFPSATSFSVLGITSASMTSNILRIMDALAVKDWPGVHGMHVTSSAPGIGAAATERSFELGLLHETQSGAAAGRFLDAMAEALSRPEGRKQQATWQTGPANPE
eukprot:CAMPEP_0115203074 /NCGR_PEP_ID=MMETSP0270-20121206/18459_1 /TAXON_ID=71861 /ORGANISM="Scrippsiella trochoidea, Strain CCMP3099" /LENGTH=133 /DNA_ID=CAMNT_0002616517 /DNA_START=1142 /DNA_END=1541 /DNA_ORIENTATION=-